MKTMKERMATMILGAVLFLGLCTGCSAVEQHTEFRSKSAPRVVTIENGKKQITVEDMGDKTVAQILEEAGITLEDGDILVVDPNSDNLLFRILHRTTVTVVDAASTYPDEVEYTLVLVGATVKDAVEAAGIEVKGNLEINYPDDAELEDKMVIVVSDSAKTKDTDEKDDEQQSPTGTNKNRNSGGNDSKPKPTPSGKTVVSTVKYEDCDGSGHGVKVITYSDGSQQEIPY